MKKQMTKTIATLLVLLIVSLGVFSVPVTAQTTIAQEKTMHFMETMLPIDLSKYTIALKNENTLDQAPTSNVPRKITTVLYHLNSENSELTVNFIIENGKIVLCSVSTIRGQVITNNPYLSQRDAVKAFLENYQVYTKIDSSNLITMMNNANISENSTTYIENTRFTIENIYNSETYQTILDWTYTIDYVDYTWLMLTFDTKGNFISLTDTRVLYKIGDTSINISAEQAIDIALENLQFYSYEMPDGSIVKDFKIGDTAAMVYTLPFEYVDYVLRPYYDVKLFLKEQMPGGVFGITVFLWADTGEIISYSNMASGGINYPDNYNPPDNSTTAALNSNTLIIGVSIVAIIAVAATGILITKKKQK